MSMSYRPCNALTLPTVADDTLEITLAKAELFTIIQSRTMATSEPSMILLAYWFIDYPFGPSPRTVAA